MTAHENAILACADETGTPVALLDTRAALIFSQHMYARTARAEDAAGKVMVALEKKLLELEAEEGGAWMTREELRQNKGSTAQSAVSGPSKYELSDRTLLALRILFLGFARRDWAKVDLACGVADPEQSRRAATGRAELLAKEGQHTDRLQNLAKLRRFWIGGGIGAG